MNTHLPALVALFLAPFPYQQSALTAKQVFERSKSSVVKVVSDKATGTGFFVKNGKTVITCFHVIKDASKLTVEGSDGVKWEVQSVAFDKESDAAVLRLSVDSGRSALKLVDFSKVAPGDEVCVLGNPLGFLQQSLTRGIVSAIRKEGTTPFVQTDAAISPGSSGSPLLNMNAEVLGFISFHFVKGESLNMAVGAPSISNLLGEDSIPLSTFLRSEPAAPKKEAAETGTTVKGENAALEALQAQYGLWYQRVVKALMRWDAYHIRAVQTSSDGIIEDSFRRARELNDEISDRTDLFDSFRETGQDAKTWGTFLEQCSEMRKQAIEVASAQSEAYIASRKTAERLKAANADASAQRSRLYSLVHGNPIKMRDPKWTTVYFVQNLPPPVQCFMYPPTLAGVVPDPAFEDQCRLLASTRTSGLVGVERIVGISLDEPSTFVEVKSWRDIRLFLLDKRPSTVRIKTDSGELIRATADLGKTPTK